jgi:hypothetical protein
MLLSIVEYVERHASLTWEHQPADRKHVQGAVPVLLQSLQNTFARERQIADRLADDMPQGIG